LKRSPQLEEQQEAAMRSVPYPRILEKAGFLRSMRSNPAVATRSRRRSPANFCLSTCFQHFFSSLPFFPKLTSGYCRCLGVLVDVLTKVRFGVTDAFDVWHTYLAAVELCLRVVRDTETSQ